MVKESELTPLMQQYVEIKKDFKDALLLFQVGDFYELFYDDAKAAAHFLGIALTSRNKNDPNPIPLCGVPVHALDYYVSKLVKGGFHIAICDQLEEPTPGKVVKRGVTRVMTPGTLTETQLLDEKSSSYLLSYACHADNVGVVFFELLTGQLMVTTFSASDTRLLEAELVRFFPDEIVLGEQERFAQHFFKQAGFTVSLHAVHEHEHIIEKFFKQFNESSVHIIDMNVSVKKALTILYSYLLKNQPLALKEMRHVTWYEPDAFLMLDAATQKNLELVNNNQDGSRSNTLCEVLDHAVTAMGSRMIKKWIIRPLKDRDLIQQRQDFIDYFIRTIELHKKIRTLLASVGDLERAIGRMALDRAHVHDYIHLMRAMESLYKQIDILQDLNSRSLVRSIMYQLQQLEFLYHLLTKALYDDAAHEWIIKPGYHEQLDHVRNLVEHSTQALLEFEQQEQKRTGISSLKVRYNQVNGYYIEITKTHVDKVPEEYVRSQTLVGRERYTCLGLKKLEQDIMSAHQEVERIEQEVFLTLKQEAKKEIYSLRRISHDIAEIDALFGLAMSAYKHHYIKPEFSMIQKIDIQQGRHPVLDALHPREFIANDVHLDDSCKMLIITGPNMGGKSTYLRMTALIAIMNQIGSFVPATRASMPLFDRIFTRIGAGDNLAEGKSTFLMEMAETAAICTQATSQSLIILDEIGRGTSTYDGLAIAQAVVEYIHQNIGALCLFATHYHELTHMEQQYQVIHNFYAASKRLEHEILLLYKILPGSADGSFGIEVARQAGLPESVIARAFELQHGFSSTQVHQSDTRIVNLEHQIRALKHELNRLEKISETLKQVDTDNLSPKKAFDLVWHIKELI